MLIGNTNITNHNSTTSLIYCRPHCKDTISKVRNKYSQKRNCAAQSQFPHSCVCERFIYSILTIGLPILLQENMWTDPGNIQIPHQHMNVEIVDWGRAIPFLGLHKCEISLQCYWDIFIEISEKLFLYIVNKKEITIQFSTRTMIT